MSSEWRRLGDCCEKIGSGATPKGGKDSYLQAGPFTLIRSQNVYNEGFVSNGLAFISDEQARKLDNVEVLDGDVLLNITGDSVARVCLAPREHLPARVNQHVAIIRPKAEVFDSRFLRYFLVSPFQQELMLGLASAGATRNALTKGMIEDFKIPRPSLTEQRASADILAALDDRITLLRETNATLEAIAQALFKSWFIDFDPVRARQEGRASEGLDEATAALFPDSFEESELGLVPRGWRVGMLGDVLALRNERTKPSEETKALPYVPIESISAKVPFLQEYKSGEDANSSLILFRKGDILFGAMRPYFHKVCIAPFDGITRTTVFTLKSTNPNASGFALSLAFQDSTIEYATQHSEGSTIPYAKWGKSLEYMPIILPPESVQIAFSEIASSFIERANESVEQAQTLATLRDTLLPRLISGQLRLPEAEAAVEATL